eukprot:CAMPEP_0177413344 /NCGR_PEP_ID=MMETSP0368-20130122/66463_1 /TAXON_ID=447022 ORGANISM="Scrippsiella hangoei-like, Strain SHHI-4" /NCGR_SAMPLE_ID=MMETSP0368 /ASSEMBLY_ACC=CAM_ASM_000363 /LENGTH=101 /DNA_ID=CAMNT_0018882645 /DNA_START=131 /DNA_END=432 /DNA_ORIENTATION=-
MVAIDAGPATLTTFGVKGTSSSTSNGRRLSRSTNLNFSWYNTSFWALSPIKLFNFSTVMEPGRHPSGKNAADLQSSKVTDAMQVPDIRAKRRPCPAWADER